MKEDQKSQDTNQEYTESLKIDEILELNNVASKLPENDLISIGNLVVSGYDADKDSRKHWEKDLTDWTKLTLQITEPKTFPWPGAANIKFPLLATAAMQFAARAYPTLIPSNGKVVKCKVVGQDPDGQKAERAERISDHMSYQLLDEMEDWEEDMDRLLMSLPIAGTCFKKTYWDANKEKNCSKLVLPKYLVVDYYAKSLEDAERVTEVIFLTKRQIRERINRDIFLNKKLGEPTGDDTFNEIKLATQMATADDETTPYTILEQHCYLDLDGDGYTEPYIVTVDYESRNVLRIVPRFDNNTVIVDVDGNVVSINAIQYYTKYSFIPNPDGGFYDIGFGRLLGPINESANTIINQLVDGGSLSNLQAGFIGKGLKIRMGDSRFSPGEWKQVSATGMELKSQIFPLPVREPSAVLFNLLDLLLKSGKELASVAEIFVGKMPGQNTPATTTMASIEQGMKVFTAVYKRIYRSLTKEFRKIYVLNKMYLNPEEYISVLDLKIEQEDYNGSPDDIIPGADPAAISAQEKQQKVQAIGQLLQLGTINPMWYTQLYMEAHEVPNWQQGIVQQQQKPDPKQELAQQQVQIAQEKAKSDLQMAQAKLQLHVAGQSQDLAHKEKLNQMDLRAKEMEAILKGRAEATKLRAAEIQHVQKIKHQQDVNRQQTKPKEVK